MLYCLISTLGMILSPIILDNVGRFGNYGLQVGCNFAAIVYIIIFIPQTKSKKKSKNILKDLIISPLHDMFKCLFKKRPNGMHWLIAIQFLQYGFYVFAFEEIIVRYFFMLKTFEGFGPVKFAMFNIYESVLCSLGLLIILPIMSKKFGLHDAAILTIGVGLEGIGNSNTY